MTTVLGIGQCDFWPHVRLSPAGRQAGHLRRAQTRHHSPVVGRGPRWSSPTPHRSLSQKFSRVHCFGRVYYYSAGEANEGCERKEGAAKAMDAAKKEAKKNNGAKRRNARAPRGERRRSSVVYVYTTTHGRRTAKPKRPPSRMGHRAAACACGDDGRAVAGPHLSQK